MQNALTLNRDRAGPILLVAIIHALIAYAFITGLTLTVVKDADEDLKTFDVAVPEAPAEEPPAPAEKAADSELVAPAMPLPVPRSMPAAPLTGNGEARPSGAIATGAIWRSGAFNNDSDYPAAARRREEQGTLRVQFTIGIDGRVSSCTVLASSGSLSLDSTTCRIIQRRFRYAPARDRAGNAVPETKAQAVTWRLERI